MNSQGVGRASSIVPLLVGITLAAGCANLEDRAPPIPRVASGERSAPEGRSPIDWSDGLSLPELLQSLERHGSSLAALESWEAARARKVTASTYPLNPELMVDGAQSVSGDKSMLGIQVRQMIELGGRVGKREDVAEAGIARAGADARDALRMLRSRARLAYWAAVVAEHKLVVSRRSTELAERQVEVVLARYQSRQASAIDVNLAKVAAAKTRAAAQLAEADYSASRAEIEALAWEAPPANWKLADGFGGKRPDPDLSRALAAAFASRPDLASLAAMGEEADAKARLASAEAAPDLGITIGYRYERDRIMGDDVDFTMTNHSATLGLSLTLPVWNRRQGEVLEAEADRRRADALRSVLATEIGRDIATAVARLRAASATLDLFEKDVIPIAEKNFEDARSAYSSGSVGITELLRAQQDSLEVLLQSVEAESAYAGARASLEAAVDRPIEEYSR